MLTLIFKKGDRQLIKNYRPISITNIDYKIIAKILANRLHTVLPDLISHDQTAYIKGRTISQTIRLVQDIIQDILVQDIILYADKHKLDTILLFLDSRKHSTQARQARIYL